MAAHHPFPRPKLTHMGDVVPRSSFLTSWERVRHRQVHWFVECLAEFTGAFLYTFAGTGPTAAYVLGNLAELQLSSVLQIGLSYAVGIVLALVICASTSGGHFHPGVTITFTVFGKVSPLKAVRYIVAQILGAYVACLLVYVQYHHLISEVELALKAKKVYDALMFTPQGPAGIFGLYITPGSPLGQVFLNEFLCDFIVGLTIFGCLDPTNFFVPPAAGPWVIAFTYAMCIWGYSPIGIALNPARDIGGILAAMSIWGTRASGGVYSAIAALTNIPVTIIAGLLYEFFFADGARVITPGHIEYLAAHTQNAERHDEIASGKLRTQSSASLDGKGGVDDMVEGA